MDAIRLPLANREAAARLLAKRLQSLAGSHPLVLAIPRGAVPMGKIIADELQGELDVVLVRKIGAPFQPELAIGSVDESAYVYRNPQTDAFNISEDYFQQEKQKQLHLINQRRRQYTPGRLPLEVQGRNVIVVDDGIATGSTMIAALHGIRARQPRRLMVATAVAPAHTVERLRAYADEVVCLASPEDFAAVGQFFKDFSQVSDAEVVAILHSAAKPLRNTS